MNRRNLIFTFLTSMSLAIICANGFGDESNEIAVTVTQPERSGVEAAMNLDVRGTAKLPAGYHLWVFVRRVDFEPFWWPQNEGKVDPEDGKWSVQTTIGGSQDVGWKFDIAVAVFDEKTHVELRDYRSKAMRSGNWPPIDMPEAAAPPQILQVMKASDK